MGNAEKWAILPDKEDVDVTIERNAYRSNDRVIPHGRWRGPCAAQNDLLHLELSVWMSEVSDL